jgi:hypothetical protein
MIRVRECPSGNFLPVIDDPETDASVEKIRQKRFDLNTLK